MPVFNSLGSNYTLGFSLYALGQLAQFSTGYVADWLGFDRDEWQPLVRVKSKLEERFGGTAFLVYKGRDAIEYALRAYGITPDQAVITQAFTCQAIEAGIERAGGQTVYADIDADTLNPSLKTLEAARKKNPHTKFVIIQHTLGNPAPMQQIASWCRQHDIVLIEDLAQSFGAEVDGQEVGSWGEVIICSFGRDKIVDAVSGGAVIFKNLPTNLQLPQIRKISPVIVARDMLYPITTWMIRTTFSFGLGKVIAKVARSAGLISNPISSPTDFVTHLPVPHARLVVAQLEQLEASLAHRRQIAQRYHQLLLQLAQQNPDLLRLLVPANSLTTGSAQRFLIWVADPSRCIQIAQQRGVFISDRWYRQPVDYGQLDLDTVYQAGSCSQAEELAQHILNLPTHRYISPSKVDQVVAAVTAYIQSSGGTV